MDAKIGLQRLAVASNERLDDALVLCLTPLRRLQIVTALDQVSDNLRLHLDLRIEPQQEGIISGSNDQRMKFDVGVDESAGRAKMIGVQRPTPHFLRQFLQPSDLPAVTCLTAPSAA